VSSILDDISRLQRPKMSDLLSFGDGLRLEPRRGEELLGPAGLIRRDRPAAGAIVILRKEARRHLPCLREGLSRDSRPVAVILPKEDPSAIAITQQTV